MYVYEKKSQIFCVAFVEANITETKQTYLKYDVGRVYLCLC